MGKFTWLLSFMLAVGMHMGVGFYYIYKPEAIQGARELGESGFEVSISMVAAQIGVQPAETHEESEEDIVEEEVVEEELELVEVVVEELIEEIVEEVQEPIIEEPIEEVVHEEIEPIEIASEEPIEEPIDIPEEPIIEPPVEEVVEIDAVIFPRPQLRPVMEPEIEKPKPIEPVKVVEAKKPDPIPQPVKEPVKKVVQVVEAKKEKVEPTKTIKATNSQGVSVTSTEVADRSDAVTQTGGGAFVGQMSPEYVTKLRYWLERHKDYPKFSKRRKQEGVVNLKFTMTRDGKVLDYAIVKSSGFEKLDEETIKMLQRAEPLPAFPNEYPGEKRTITIPVQFNLF